MRALRAATLLGALAALGALAPAPAAAAPAPVWNLDIHHTPTDFAPGSPGILEVSTSVQGSAGANEEQKVVVVAGSGAFKLSFAGKTTPDLALTATAGQVQSALRALPTIGSPNVKVSLAVNGNAHTFTVEFVSALVGKDVPQIEASSGATPLHLFSSYQFDVDNVGAAAAGGAIDVAVDLPPGITFQSGGGAGGGGESAWSCAGANPGDSHLLCTTTGPISAHNLNRSLGLAVAVDPGASGVLTASAEVSGGGAANTASAEEPTPISAEPAGLGIPAASFTPDFFEADGVTPERRSGAHPALLTVPFDFNSAYTPELSPTGNIRHIEVDLPPGFIGNPTAVEECTIADFALAQCAGATQIGRIDASLNGIFRLLTVGMFNLTHPRGSLTDFGIVVAGNPVHIRASLNPANRYAIRSTVSDINETFPPFAQQVTLWGVPADSSHDSERCKTWATTGVLDPGVKDTSEECSAQHPAKAFLSVPSQCESDNTFVLHDYTFWRHESAPAPPIAYTMPGHQTDCDVPRFEPSVEIVPTGRQANTPTGLDLNVKIFQQDSPAAPSTPPVRSTVVTLPEGMTVNPGFADGLQGCSEAQIGISAQGVPNDSPVACPDNSRIGEVTLSTPLLPKPIEGSMYLAKQGENPFGSLLALYLALHDTEERGALIKVPGKISLDPATGQITTSFSELPQFPFEDLTLKFRSGDRAPLINPPTCGSHEIAATMTSYARPDEPINVSNTYQVSEGPGGGPCQGAAFLRPFDPQLIAGALNPTAGVFSPLSVRLFRTDADQELSTAEGTAPAGLIASLRGLGRCSDAQIAAARARSHPGEGAPELASPSCPASSQIGTVQAGAGAGRSPIYVGGKVYLAGPYQGAPLSGVAIVPAVAGPVDLGNVVVRGPVFVNPDTAKVSLKTDPVPQIVNGVLIRTRDIRVRLDRPNFTLNPTSCEPKAIEATVRSTEGAVKNDSVRFQVGDCAALGFAPRLSLKLTGGTRRGAHPALKATVSPRAGDANFAAAAVTLPHSAFLDQAHIRTICTRVQFAAGAGNGSACPPDSIYGQATAYTPLLDEPLQGPALLRSSSHNLPDLVIALHGIIDVNLISRIDSRKGGIRSSFEAIPDAPVSKFVLEMQGAKKGLIVNSTDLCASTNRAAAKLTGQNGKLDQLRSPVQAGGCGKGAKHKRAGRPHR